MGDFNEVRDESERRNSEFNASNAEAFNHFILVAGLQEYNMVGGKFTYISDRGDKLSKLDRYLVCLGFMQKWPTASVLTLDRVASDHRLIILSTIQTDFGHIPFRFFNSWCELHGFLDFVNQVCGNFTFNVPEDLAIAIKLRWLKNNIKGWIKQERSRTKGVYEDKKKRATVLDNLAEERLLLEDELHERADCKSVVSELDRLKFLDTRQKSRARWAVEGDENSAFFDHIINSNISINRVNALKVDGVWVSNPVVIKEVFYEIFSKQFTEPMGARLGIMCPNLSTISDSEAVMLEAPFSIVEIKNAI
ncbi:uncharacterized protein LOC110869446 [Helianthus annuus]|uniref:uncharacterized protein LOC110869446 n=1 Tax=Helianthus annuus TaxID=4232 RepID=UPI000B9009AA|nr:uncharacterized protein LOC110869446 [Helianthus annuus]